MTEEGQFQWHKQEAPGAAVESLNGTLAPDSLAELVAAIEAAGEGPITDDAGIVQFRWNDSTGEVQSKLYYSPFDPPCSELLALIESLARQHGQP